MLAVIASQAPVGIEGIPIRVEVPTGATLGSVEETILTASCLVNPANRVSNTDRVYYLLPTYFPMVKYEAP